MTTKLKLVNKIIEILPPDDTTTYPRLNFHLRRNTYAVPVFKNSEESTDTAANFRFRNFTFYIPKVIKKTLFLTDSNYKMMDLYKDYLTRSIIRDEFQTSTVSNMSSMFENCTNLTSLTEFDTSNANNMQNMFAGCTSLPAIFPWVIDCSSITNASNMTNMFSGSSVTSVKLFNVKSVIKSSITSALLASNSSLTIEFIDKTFTSSQLFTSNGTFTVPEGVTSIYVTASAGGGGGGGGPFIAPPRSMGNPSAVPYQSGINGSKGGNTSVGSLLTLSGGNGGESTQISSHQVTRWGNNATSYPTNIGNSTLNSTYGNGGSGCSYNGTTMGGKGGKGENCERTRLIVNFNTILNITVGAGGTYGYGGHYGSSGQAYYGTTGQPGFVLIEWDNPIS